MRNIFLLFIGISISTNLYAACDGQTVLLLHSDGADTSTTFTDSSASAHTMTANGNAQIDTAQSKFGGASGLYDGTGDYLTTPDSADWHFRTSDFTVDFWVRFNTIVGSSSYTLMDIGAGATFELTLNTTANELRVILNGIVYSASWTPVINTWYHVALERDGTNMRTFINGTQIGITQTSTDDINGITSLGIGARNNGVSPIDGWIDEFRISKGIARWTTNFTPSSSAYCSTTTDSMMTCFE